MDKLVAMRVFERVANEGGFAAAARALDISPPVVTRLVAELEAHLGARLFQRTTRRVVLTEAGETYLRRVRQILQDIEEADGLVSAATNELKGWLRVQAQPAIASYMIAPLIASFQRAYPGIRIDLAVNAFSSASVEDYDVTLFGAGPDFDANIIARKIIESKVMLVASADYIARRGYPQTPADLSQHDCLFLEHPDRPMQAWYLWPEDQPEQLAEVKLNPVLVANHTDTLIRAARDGLGITTTVLNVVAPYLARGELVQVLHPWVAGQLALYAALPSRKFVPQRSRVFMEYLAQQIRSLDDKALAICAETHLPD